MAVLRTACAVVIAITCAEGSLQQPAADGRPLRQEPAALVTPRPGMGSGPSRSTRRRSQPALSCWMPGSFSPTATTISTGPPARATR